MHLLVIQMIQRREQKCKEFFREFIKYETKFGTKSLDSP